jgi:hypothetical protein
MSKTYKKIEPKIILPVLKPVLKAPVFTVPKGQSLNCRSEIVGPGGVVTPDMVIGGMETLELLATKGAVIKS